MLKAGQRIGRYEVVDRIGHGGLASVYRVRHTELDSIFALKLLEVHRPQLRVRLMEEGRAQASLVHPNVVRVTDILVHDEMPVLIMEFVDGPSLEQLILETGALNPTAAVDLAVGITRGLRAAHAVGLVHRDLKPGNVLLERSPDGFVPKLADFGLVKVLREDQRGQRAPTQHGVAMGTPQFMAPEQIRDAATVDHRADLYSLGCLLYLLLTGALPFVGVDLLQLHDQILLGAHSPSIRRPTVPSALDRLVMRLLRPDPAERPGSCDEVLAVLEGGDLGGPAAPLARPAALQAAASRSATSWSTLPAIRRPWLGRPLSRWVLAVPLLVPIALALGSLGSAPPALGPQPAGSLTTESATPPKPAASPGDPAPRTVSPPEPSTEAPLVAPGVAPAVAPGAAPGTAPPEPQTGPSPAPVDPPAPPPDPQQGLATVDHRGDASRVWLTHGDELLNLPGAVPPGEYDVVALFPGTEPIAAGKLIIGDERRVTLVCSAFALRCRTVLPGGP